MTYWIGAVRSDRQSGLLVCQAHFEKLASLHWNARPARRKRIVRRRLGWSDYFGHFLLWFIPDAGQASGVQALLDSVPDEEHDFVHEAGEGIFAWWVAVSWYFSSGEIESVYFASRKLLLLVAELRIIFTFIWSNRHWTIFKWHVLEWR